MDTKQYNDLQNEGGEGYNPFAARDEAAIIAARKARIAHVVANFPAYRDRWNEAVAKHTVNGQVPTGALQHIERDAGVTQIEMRLAKSQGA